MKNINNKLYISLVMVLCVFTYLLNFFNQIFECSFVFVFLILTTNIISELYGQKKAVRSILLCIIISFCLLWNLDYYIDGYIINRLVLTSFLSVFLSTYCGISLFLKLKSVYSFHIRNFICLIVCAIVDGIVMAGFFINQFSVNRIVLIFFKEVSFKCLYSLTACIFIFVGYLIQKIYRPTGATYAKNHHSEL